MIVLSLRMPLRFLRGNYARLALTVIALACGVAQICATDLVSERAVEAFVATIDTMAGRAALQITARGAALFPEDIASVVAAVPGVKSAVPVVSATAFTADDTGELLTVQGVNLADDATVRAYELRERQTHGLDDPHLLLPDSIVLTRAFADRHGLAKRDHLTLETPTGRRTLTVRGLLEPHGIACVYGGNFVIMDLYGAQAIFARAGFINRIDVLVWSNEDLTRVEAAVAQAVPTGLQVETPTHRKADLHRVMRTFRVALRGVGLVGLVAAFLIAFNRLATVYEARAWQLGVLRAVGVRSRDVWRELMKESLLLGAMGVVLGMLLGVWIARFVQPLITRTAMLAYNLTPAEAEPAVPASSLLLAAGLGLAATVLAAALPARRATRLAPAVTLRSRGSEQRGLSAARQWLLCGLVAASGGIAVALQALMGAATWGLAASGIGAVAMALLGRPLVEISSQLLVRAARSLALPSMRFAAVNVGRNSRRSGLMVATLGVGFGAVLLVRMISQSFEQSVIDSLAEAGLQNVDLVISSAHVASGFREAPIDEGLLGEIRTVPGIAGVFGQRGVEWAYDGGVITIQAMDPALFGYPRLIVSSLLPSDVEAARAVLARGEAFVVSSNFALNFHVRVGDVITVDTPSGKLTHPIAALTTLVASPRGTIQMSRELYAQLWHDRQITRAYVRIKPDSDIGAVRAAIAGKLGRKYGLRMLSSGDLVEYFVGQVSRAFAGVHVLAGVVLCVVFVGMLDTLTASVLERTRELGMIRALGVRRRHLQRVVRFEALLLGTFGLILGGAGGLALGALWVQASFPLLLGWVLELHVPYAHAAAVAGVLILTCLIAAALPARRAARLDPAAALRDE